MSAKLIHIGFGHYFDQEKIVVVAMPHSAPIKRSIKDAKEKGVIVDLTEGRRTKSAIFTTSKYLVLSALEPVTIQGRVEGFAAG